MTTITVLSPVNGKEVGTVRAHSAEETRMAFEIARQAQKEWAQVPLAKRKKIFLSIHDAVLDHQTELMDTVCAETGKARKDAFEEVLDVALSARHLGFAGPRLLKRRHTKPGIPVLNSVHVDHCPVGVVGVIAPWNYPLALAASDALAAIMAGNAAVLKPDSHTPLTALIIAEVLYSAGLPRDLFQVLPGSGEVVGQAIAESCDYLMFTGSTQTGTKLAAQAGNRLIGFSGELGGKNAMIVSPDADIERAAQGAVTACFSNAGQLCISIERIYVVDKVFDAFVSSFLSNVNAMRIGPKYGWNADMGPLISHEHLKRVSNYVADAVDKGAQILTGGHSLSGTEGIGDAGCYFEPTVLVDVPEDAELYTEEVFGPVVYVEKVASLEEAVTKTNATSYGLNASVWGRVATAQAVANRLEVGTVNINEGYATAWIAMSAPMGGWKSSGVGRRHGVEGLLKYTEARTVAVQRLTHLTGPAGVDRQQFATAATEALRLLKGVLR